MNTSHESGLPEFELDLDLHFLPAWAKQSPTENRYARCEGEPGGGVRRDDRGGGRDPRRDRPPRREGHREGPGPTGQRPGGPRRDGPRPNRFEPHREKREPVAPPKIDITVSFIPEEKGVESLARQIRLTGRAYPLFDIAFLILKKPDRYNVCFSVIKRPDGQIAQPLFVCGLDDTLWLSEREAMDYILDKHFSIFYQPERTPTDPPKGTYTFVAQCGMSGTILGPPNYHDYQNKLRKLHAERFSRMSFEAFKTRIKIVKDEAVVKKWLEDQSWKTEYIVLNVPDQIKLANREEVEKHFREVHLPNVVKPVESHTVGGTVAQSLPSRTLQSLVRRAWDEQMRFPLRVVTTLSQQFAALGLQFFKVNKTVTHVAVARPRYLDLEVTPVSDGIRRIVEFIAATPQCSRRKILEALVPGQVLQQGQAPEPAAEAVPPSPEAAAVISNLHWLIHQGHVIEFANGLIELAKKPAPRPPKTEKAPAADSAAAAAESATAESSEAAPIPTEREHESEAPAASAPKASATVESDRTEPEPATPSGSEAAATGQPADGAMGAEHNAVASASSADLPAEVPADSEKDSKQPVESSI